MSFHPIKLSVVVVVFNIPREVRRTLRSLSAQYQRHIDAADYEIIVVDNGSTPPVSEAVFEGLAGCFRLIRIDLASPSPACAVNRGLKEARGNLIGVMIDGARLVTPGLLHFALHGSRLHPRAIVVALGWYLGFDLQRWAMESGYGREQEDELLTSINWPEDGYRLFEIATPDESSVNGWFQPLIECNTLFLSRETWEIIAGMDERFDFPGGGLVNLDTYRRAAELPESEQVILLGEASFHQFHGGVATNATHEPFQIEVERWHEQYAELRGSRYQAPKIERKAYLGTLPPAALVHILRAATSGAGPLGRNLNTATWSVDTPPRPTDRKIAEALDIMYSEFRAGRYPAVAAVGRLVRKHAPDEPEVLRLLTHAGPFLRTRENGRPSPQYLFAMGEAHRIFGDLDTAKALYKRALEHNNDFTPAYVALAKLRMPGELYYRWLDRLHGAIRPATYLEIGVDTGRSLGMVRPPTKVIGVDPTPKINAKLQTETHIFTETSDEFFARKRLDGLLDGAPLSLAFIDGLHVFEQALKDFANVEAYCGPQSVVLLHDTYPADEVTQRPERQREFYTGDVWKIVPCLKRFRPDLDIFTIATPWSGLTVVIGFDPEHRRLANDLEAAVAEFKDILFADMEDRMREILNVVPNNWPLVAERLKRRGIPV